MRRSIAGSVALVTGAGRGIGRAVAVALAEEGCDLTLLARSENELDETAALCRDHDVGTVVLPADISDVAALERSVAACVAELGGLNILVNNAGMFAGAPAPEADPDGWERMLQVNLLGAMRATHLALPHI